MIALFPSNDPVHSNVCCFLMDENLETLKPSSLSKNSSKLASVFARNLLTASAISPAPSIRCP